MFCSRCGKQVEEGNQFCQFCGQEVGAAAIAAPAASGAPAPPSMASAPAAAPRRYAGFWIRLVAALVDGLILGIPFWIIVASVIGMSGGFAMMLRRLPQGSAPPDPREVMAVMAPLFGVFLLGWFAFLIVEWLYYAGMESSARQATIGKSVMSLRVTNYEGKRISFGHATGRFAGKVLNRFIPLGIGFIMAGFTEKKQALHDLIAGTLVVKQ